MANFNDLMALTQEALTTRLVHGDEAGDSSFVPNLFYAGYAVGLTNKEIVAELLKPVVVELRPGLKRS